MKTVLYIFSVVVLSGLLSSSAQALTPLGPPRSRLKREQHSLGFVFASSEMDLNFSGPGGSVTLSDFESETYLARLGYGISDGCELYTLLGSSDLSAYGVKGDSEFSWGFGTKFTVAKKDSVTWGGLFQLCSISSEWSATTEEPFLGYTSANLDFQLYDIQIAFGPTYAREAFSIYGGPFLHFVDGEVDVNLNGDSGTADIEQESEFGGYIGAMLELAESSSLFIEYQMTGDASAIAGGFVWRF